MVICIIDKILIYLTKQKYINHHSQKERSEICKITKFGDKVDLIDLIYHIEVARKPK